MKNGYEKMIGATVRRESEKAILVSVLYGDVAKKDVWMPKSQVEVREDGVWASSWILDQKSEMFGNELHHIETESATYAPNPDAKPF